MKSLWIHLSILVLSALIPDVSLRAQSPASLKPTGDGHVSLRNYREVALAPDGKRVAWVEYLADKGARGSATLAIYIVNQDAANPTPRRVRFDREGLEGSQHSITWSPDGQRLAFLSDCEKEGQLQLYVVTADGGQAQRMTSVNGLIADPRWSPDGSRIGLLFTQGISRAAGPMQPGEVQTGVIDEKVSVQRLSMVELSSSEFRQVSSSDLHVYEYDWSPDGSQCAAIAARPPGDNNWYIAQLYTVAMATGQMTSILKPKMQIAVPRWSPDGRHIALIGGLMSDEGVTGGDVYLIPTTGGAPRNLTPDLKGSASWLAWHPSSQSLLLAEHFDGGSALTRVDLTGAAVRLWNGDATITAVPSLASLSVSTSRDQTRFAMIRQSFLERPEVWTGAPGRWRALTQANRELRSDLGTVESLHWKSDDFEIQGWLLAPRSINPGGRYPLIVFVHGGPSSVANPRWLDADSLPMSLSRRGYYVLMPNPRGSFGKGERFTRANVKDFGYGDLRDILRGVDEVIRTRQVDEDRIGITGWSYGGYMTMWAVTQTGRFRAAVAGAGICNWQSYYGQNGIDQWMIPFFGASVYDDPAVYARSSPITFIKQANTPTLILVGERDVECPVPQSQEFYHALKALGVGTQMVVYPGEGHMMLKEEHRRDVVERTIGWFEHYLKPRKGNSRAADY